MKVCPVCQVEKPASEFMIGSHGQLWRCRPCHAVKAREARRKHRHAHPERETERQRDYRRRKKEKERLGLERVLRPRVNYPIISGTYFHSVDEKGRSVLPADFRKAFGTDLIFCCLPERTAVVMPAWVWGTLPFRDQGPVWNEYVLTHSYKSTAAKNGRVLIPYPVRDHLGMMPGDEAAWAGFEKVAFLRRRAEWQAHVAPVETGFMELLKRLAA